MTSTLKGKMNEIFIPVIGIPAPQGSKRHVGHGIMIENSKRVKPWRNDVKDAALEHYQGEIIDQAVEIEIIFLFARPKSHYGTGKNATVSYTHLTLPTPPYV